MGGLGVQTWPNGVMPIVPVSSANLYASLLPFGIIVLYFSSLLNYKATFTYWLELLFMCSV